MQAQQALLQAKDSHIQALLKQQEDARELYMRSMEEQLRAKDDMLKSLINIMSRPSDNGGGFRVLESQVVAQGSTEAILPDLRLNNRIVPPQQKPQSQAKFV